MKQYVTLILLLSFNLGFSQTRVKSLVSQLKQKNFDEIYKVKDSIINFQKEAIPELIELLKDTSFVKLENTADLIYPGAKEFYGHGWIVSYDIDWISVRAAWLLEEITFQNFGYQYFTINEDMLMNLHKQNYNKYLETGSHSIDFKNKTPREKQIVYRLMLADSVEKWWGKNKDTWTRLDALTEALSNTDIHRQSLALHYLRFDHTKCDGLTLENFKNKLRPLVKKIRQSKNGQADQAKYLLDDDEFYWYKGK